MTTGRRVLVVEDNPRNLKLVRDVLTHYGFEVIEATTGEEGVRLAAQVAPDLVLMDLQLPGIDGTEALRLLRGGREHPLGTGRGRHRLRHGRRPRAGARLRVRRLRREADQCARPAPTGGGLPRPRGRAMTPRRPTYPPRRGRPARLLPRPYPPARYCPARRRRRAADLPAPGHPRRRRPCRRCASLAACGGCSNPCEPRIGRRSSPSPTAARSRATRSCATRATPRTRCIWSSSATWPCAAHWRRATRQPSRSSPRGTTSASSRCCAPTDAARRR